MRENLLRRRCFCLLFRGKRCFHELSSKAKSALCLQRSENSLLLNVPKFSYIKHKLFLCMLNMKIPFVILFQELLLYYLVNETFIANEQWTMNTNPPTSIFASSTKLLIAFWKVFTTIFMKRILCCEQFIRKSKYVLELFVSNFVSKLFIRLAWEFFRHSLVSVLFGVFSFDRYVKDTKRRHSCIRYHFKNFFLDFAPSFVKESMSQYFTSQLNYSEFSRWW